MTLSPLFVTLILYIQNLLLQMFCQVYIEVVWQGYIEPEENKEGVTEISNALYVFW